MSPPLPLPLPTITLPPHIAPHLRALIYASTPGTTITNLTLSAPPTQKISLSQLPPTIPLHHPPLPRKTSYRNLFFDCFPLTAYLHNDTLIFATTLPNVVADLSEEVPLPKSALVNTPLSITLQSLTAKQTNGLVTLSAGKYEPLIKPTRDTIGAWGKGHPVFLNAALLQLSRYLYRRCNRRLGNNHLLRKQIALLRFTEDGTFITRGCITVDGVRKWICRVPLRGGCGEFRVVGGDFVPRSGVKETVETGLPRPTEAGDRNRAVDLVSGGAAVVEEDEFMVAKMREFNFGRVEETANESVVEGVVPDEVIDIDEETTELSPQFRVQQVDLDSLANETCTTTTSSDDEREEAMLETLCKQYLNQGWTESINRELSRLDNNTLNERR